MPKILIDTERLRDLNSGLGQVCLHLGHQLAAHCPGGWQLTFLVPVGQTGIFGFEAGGEIIHYIEARWWHKVWLPDHYDVWHCLHQDSAYLPSRAHLILTIYDLNFLERTDYSVAKKARRLAALQRKINRASLLTAGSAYTASVVRERLTLPVTLPLKVVYSGVAISEQDLPTTFPEPAFLAGSDQPFFLFVGVIHPKKNVHTLLPLLEAFPDYRLVLAGPNGHDYARHIREQAEQIGISDRLITPGTVDETTKIWLYKHCEAFLFPSLSEGFGLPVVEAMSLGKPVFLSNLTSLPEIGGQDAVYFKTFEPDDLVETFRLGMQDFYDDPLKADRLRWRANRFNWQRIAQEYWTLYAEVAGTVKAE